MTRLLPPALIAGCVLVLSATPAAAAEGAVKWFNAEKGFGFIAADGGGADVLVSTSAARADTRKTDFTLAG